MKYFPNIAVSRKAREDTLGEKYNRALGIAPADIYVTMVDYAPILTKGFDHRIAEAAAIYPDRLVMVHGHWANLSFPSMQAVTRQLVEAMGYIYPPYFPYWFVDHWLQDIASMIERKSFADVWVDHVTRRPQKTLEMRDCAFWATFYDAAYPLRRQIAINIIDAMDDDPARKKALIRNWPVIEERSTILNDIVRGQDREIVASRGTGAPDERYARVKAKAQDLLGHFIRYMEQEATGGT